MCYHNLIRVAALAFALYIMGMQPIWRTKQKKFSLLGIEIYSHVKKSYCSVLQIGCISTDVEGVYCTMNTFFCLKIISK